MAFVSSLWHRLPINLRRRIWSTAGASVRQLHARICFARPTAAPPSPTTPLVVAGLFTMANGIGEGARLTWQALKKAGLHPLAVDVSDAFGMPDMAPEIPLSQMPADREGILILQVNGPEVTAALHRLGMRRDRNWFTVGYWAWELPVFPCGWDSAFPFLSELWTPSRFSADAIMQHNKAPKVRVIPHPYSPRVPDKGSLLAQLDLPHDSFVCLTFADSLSSLERKNPLAAITAFRRAFVDDPSCILLVKTRNIDTYPTARHELEEAAEGAHNIHLLDVVLSSNDRDRLVAATDILISLHRSEGFGLTIAEAMSLGKPCVVTNWSGNTQFTDDQNTASVSYRLVPVCDRYDIYSKGSGAVWADPSIEEAAEQLLMLRNNPQRAQHIGQAAKHTVMEKLDLSKIGLLMRSSLKQ